MLNHLNLNLLRSLHILLEERHVSRAAERLHLTQSAVSRQLAQLRELCDDPLLVRDGNGLVATPHALAMQDKLSHLLTEFDDLIANKAFDPKTCKQEFVISSSDYVAQYIIPLVMNQLTAQAPNIDITYRLWQPDFLTSFNETGIHIASTMLPHKPEHLSSVKIGEDKTVCLMRSDHPLRDSSQLTPEELLCFPHLKVTGGGDKDSMIDSHLKQLGLKRRIGLKVPFFSAAVNTLKNTDFIMLVPEHIANNLAKEEGLLCKPIPFVTTVHKYWLIWHPKFDQDRAHQWIRERVLHAIQNSHHSIGYDYKS